MRALNMLEERPVQRLSCRDDTYLVAVLLFAQSWLWSARRSVDGVNSKNGMLLVFACWHRAKSRHQRRFPRGFRRHPYQRGAVGWFVSPLKVQVRWMAGWSKMCNIKRLADNARDGRKMH